MKGHIEITDKVEFVPDKLPKPKWLGSFNQSEHLHRKKMEEYYASKKTVEVSNVYFSTLAKAWLFKRYTSHKLIVKNNQECEAEVTDNKATIIKLIK